MMQDAIAEYATWTEPDTLFQVHYSLQVFHEIDFGASEGYRRIPHGGIEVGGLLFGRRFLEGVRIEAFRPIECEHAMGPSFKLSERDLSALREQIERTAADPELGGLETLGWFIAHTRGPLQLTEAEALQFDDLLPGPGMMTVLVKPEKFKPTLFAFFVRRRDGRVNVNGADRAIILPLPGRAGRSSATSTLSGPIPSLDAPVESAHFQIPPEEPFLLPDDAPPPEPIRSVVQQRPVVKDAPPIEQERIVPPAEAEPVRPQPLPWQQRTESTLGPRPTTQFPVAPPPVPVVPRPQPVVPPSGGPPPFEWKFDRTPVEQPLFGQPMQPAGRREARKSGREGRRSGTIATLVLLAAILGTASGYWIYRQMPPPVISLTVEPRTEGLFVVWPAEQTGGSAAAFIRVNDGPVVELPTDAKVAGRWQVQPGGGNLKIELVAKHLLHDSRGIVRYIDPAYGP
jgi:hypothetical protein